MEIGNLAVAARGEVGGVGGAMPARTSSILPLSWPSTLRSLDCMSLRRVRCSQPEKLELWAMLRSQISPNRRARRA